MSTTMDKVKHALHLDKDKSATSTTHSHNTTSGTAEGVAGHHNSRLANATDPRIDSDLDGSHTVGSSTHGTTHNTSGNYTGAGTGAVGNGSTNVGPHSSGIANKMDPRIDSDQDGSRNMGVASHTTTSGAYSGTGAGNNLGSTGTHGGISSSTNAGPHDSNLANRADPRVDSDLNSTGNRHGAHTGGIIGTSGSHATPGSGTAQNTAGPHNTDIGNKLDPRVDANLDGSKTYGGNRTHA